tara:strand:- start:1872 stop:2264 length:393 start_codon:yes stop_codon:yes gene_type:complete
MSENFNLEIISPDKTLFKTQVTQATIPSFEGLMSVLKDHIPLVTFLRPGFIEIKTDKENERFFVEEGIVEFNDNNLLILSSTVKDLKNFSKDQVDKIMKDSEEEIKKENINDKEKYILSHKLESLKEIRK